MGSMQWFEVELHAAVHDEYYKGESDHVNELHFNALFNEVADVLKRSTSVAEKCLLGKNIDIIENNLSVPSINCSPYVLKQIYSAVVTAFGAESKHDDVVASIVKVLSTYSGAEKAVLTLAAFASSYGELLVFVDRQQLNPFALLISSLWRVDEIIRVQKEEQFKKAITGLNELTKLTIKFIGLILVLDDLSKKDCIDDMSVVTKITDIIEGYSLIAIQALVTCMIVVSYPTYYRITTGKISSQASSLNDQLTKLKETVEKYKLLIEEWEAYSKLHSCICSRSGIVKVMTCMMSPCDPFLERKEKTVHVAEVLRGKNVLLFISELDISMDDFFALKTIHDWLEEERHNYKIVWIPVVEKWTREALKKFDTWKKKMPWYVVSYETGKRIVGIKYIKKRWHFGYEPMVVVLNSRGAVESLDAMHMIRAWGKFAFPFSRIVPDPVHCMRPIIFDIIKQEIDEEKYILLYGGKDEAWINAFAKNVTELEESVGAKITLTSFAIGEKISNSKEIMQFWTRIESLLFVRMQRNLLDDVTTKFQELLSLKKSKSGWAILCKGPNVLACTSGTMIMDAVIEYQEWTMNIGKRNFEVCLQEYLETKGQQHKLPCIHVPFPSFSPGLPVHVKCPGCGARMERNITYKCCHREKAHSKLIENGHL